MTEQQDGFPADSVGRTEYEERFGGGKTKHSHVICDHHERLHKHTVSVTVPA